MSIPRCARPPERGSPKLSRRSSQVTPATGIRSGSEPRPRPRRADGRRVSSGQSGGGGVGRRSRSRIKLATSRSATTAAAPRAPLRAVAAPRSASAARPARPGVLRRERSSAKVDDGSSSGSASSPTVHGRKVPICFSSPVGPVAGPAKALAIGGPGSPVGFVSRRIPLTNRAEPTCPRPRVRRW